MEKVIIYATCTDVTLFFKFSIFSGRKVVHFVSVSDRSTEYCYHSGGNNINHQQKEEK